MGNVGHVKVAIFGNFHGFREFGCPRWVAFDSTFECFGGDSFYFVWVFNSVSGYGFGIVRRAEGTNAFTKPFLATRSW